MNLEQILPPDIPDAIDCVAAKLIEYESSTPHIRGGLSQHGSCVAKQIYDRIYPQPFDGHGATVGGTALHEYMQLKLLPSGTVIPDENGEPLYLVIAHEQVVIYREEGKDDRVSPIDTLVRNLKNNEYEIWDWKSTRKGGTRIAPMAYVKDASSKYKYQANFYGYLFMKAWKLPYLPVCRIMYFNKNDWTHVKEFAWRVDLEMAEQSETNIFMVDFVVSTYEVERNKDEWSGLATGRKVYSTTSKPYLEECRYCHHQNLCAKNTGDNSVIDA